ncbi:hypothetical protein KL86PLE_10278 [uncultured Pleomorphomonas sp.]|uniref:Uncharacterized protein n=1 Tax=uncultured Pleomorphomonas sp. TaxID=442121 RepID=A0A212KZN9_9HYPH|nr:hypothetical protein KL86PLE_10278 [uncultured Pleomorphomonas sp.]
MGGESLLSIIPSLLCFARPSVCVCRNRKILKHPTLFTKVQPVTHSYLAMGCCEDGWDGLKFIGSQRRADPEWVEYIVY